MPHANKLDFGLIRISAERHTSDVRNKIDLPRSSRSVVQSNIIWTIDPIATSMDLPWLSVKWLCSSTADASVNLQSQLLKKKKKRVGQATAKKHVPITWVPSPVHRGRRSPHITFPPVSAISYWHINDSQARRLWRCKGRRVIIPSESRWQPFKVDILQN